MKPITVLIVDDSAFIRQMLHEILSTDPGIKVVGEAADPYDAREKIKKLNPDVLTLDIEMPKMDGLTFLEKIMSLRPMPVVMLSSLTQRGADSTIRALEIGAFDTISKPATQQTAASIMALKEEIIDKVKAAATANIQQRRATPQESGQSLIVPFNPQGPLYHEVIAIGSSTGGVEALRELFLRLPENSPPIVITQHMPQHFTTSFATRLSGLSKVKVNEARNHDRLKVGHAYIAPGNFHLKVVRLEDELVCKIEDGPLVSGHRPSVDVLFHSVAEAVGPKAIGVILTGMGKDGAEGMLAMRNKGSYNVGQNKASCVVYGMPQVAASIGATHKELPLLDIPAHILQLCENRGKK
jgi:two-component system chemotaxis response regulator CheB